MAMGQRPFNTAAMHWDSKYCKASSFRFVIDCLFLRIIFHNCELKARKLHAALNPIYSCYTVYTLDGVQPYGAEVRHTSRGRSFNCIPIFLTLVFNVVYSS